jgi:hypothetical protein
MFNGITFHLLVQKNVTKSFQFNVTLVVDVQALGTYLKVCCVRRVKNI